MRPRTLTPNNYMYRGSSANKAFPVIRQRWDLEEKHRSTRAMIGTMVDY